MDWLRALLESSPLAALFLTIAAGYLIGEINLKGFSLGSGAVLFVGLACGAFAPKSTPPGLVGTLGLMLFLYCVGIQYGAEWYARPHQRRRVEGQRRGALRRGRRGCGLDRDLPGRRGEPAPGARDVCGLRHEHARAPGRPRCAAQPGRRGRLWRHVSVRRRRADPVHVCLPGDLQTEDRATSRPPDPAGRSQRAERRVVRQAVPGASADPRWRRPGRRHPSSAAEPRAHAGHPTRGERRAPHRRDRSRRDRQGTRVDRRRRGWRSRGRQNRISTTFASTRPGAASWECRSAA